MPFDPLTPLRALLQAYQDGADRGGSVRWEDIDAVHLQAQQVLDWYEDPEAAVDPFAISPLAHHLGSGWQFLQDRTRGFVVVLHETGLYTRVSLMAIEVEEAAAKAIADALNLAVDRATGNVTIEVTREQSDEGATYSAIAVQDGTRYGPLVHYAVAYVDYTRDREPTKLYAITAAEWKALEPFIDDLSRGNWRWPDGLDDEVIRARPQVSEADLADDCETVEVAVC